MVEDVADDVRVGEAGDDLEASVAPGTAGDVLLEDAAEERRPIEAVGPGRPRAPGLGLGSSKRRCVVVAGHAEGVERRGQLVVAGFGEGVLLVVRGDGAVVGELLGEEGLVWVLSANQREQLRGLLAEAQPPPRLPPFSTCSTPGIIVA